MNFNFDREQSSYQLAQRLKKDNKPLYDNLVLFNQKILMACGKIDGRLQQLSDEERERFISEHQSFFNGFAWSYYQDWRKVRAKSCAALMDIYKKLNVKMSLHNFVGETFYAGIPKVTVDEVNHVIEIQQNSQDLPVRTALEKIGNDGELHPCDEYGCFID